MSPAGSPSPSKRESRPRCSRRWVSSLPYFTYSKIRRHGSEKGWHYGKAKISSKGNLSFIQRRLKIKIWRHKILELLFWNRIILFFIIEWSGGTSPQGHLGLGPWCGTGRLGHYKIPGMRHSVWDGLWRPAEAFFQIGLGCVMSHQHTVYSCSNFGGKIQNGVPANN